MENDLNRRQAMGSMAVAAAGLGISPARSSPPNIVIIMADDLGWGDLSCYGSNSISTPNIDRIADEGVRMTSFYSCSPVCSPSRAGLLTGRYPVRSGVNFVFVPKELFLLAALEYAYYDMPWGLPVEEITLADQLKESGYSTCCIGKWHLGDLPRYLPDRRGFDHYFGILHSNDAFPLRLYRNRQVVEGHPVNQDLLTGKYTNEALDWLSQNHDRPFFLYFAHTFPHIPLHASAEFRGRSKAGIYGDCVEEIDCSVGEILNALEKYGLFENTFVFFTSDNGPWFEGRAALRGRKGQTLEGGMRVPGLARFPRVLPPGAVCDRMSMNFDLFTTSLALAGCNPPHDRSIDGKNIMPMLAGEQPSPHQALYFYRFKELQAMRTPRWKYHRPHEGWSDLPTYLSKRPMLFDLKTEQTESYNVIDTYPEQAEKMDRMMREWEENMVKGVPGS